MRIVALSLGLVSLVGCASSGVATFGKEQLVSGENGDLRVFVDHKCPQAVALDNLRQKHVYVEKSGGGLALEVLSHIGAIAFKSFGTFLQKAGEASVTQSVGATGGYFYTANMDISPAMKCIYVVRNGFALQSAQFASSAPGDLRKTWGELGLNKTPDFFAILHLETTADAELMDRLPERLDYLKNAPQSEGEPSKLRLSPPAPYFRARLDRLYVREFQNPRTASDYRDLAIVLNFGLAASRAEDRAERADRGSSEHGGEPGSVLAAGGVRIHGMQKGDYREDFLVALQTGWMRMPKVQKDDDPRGTVDLSVYVVESAPGNPLLQSIGAYLAGDDVAASVVGAVRDDLKK